MLYVTNAFSLNMLAPETFPCAIHADTLTPLMALEIIRNTKPDDLRCTLGHLGIVSWVNQQLGTTFTTNRESIQLKDSDLVLVAQYRGPRLPEGATNLPDGATIEWFSVILREV